MILHDKKMKIKGNAERRLGGKGDRVEKGKLVKSYKMEARRRGIYEGGR